MRFSRRGEDDGDGVGGEEESGERDRGEGGDVEKRFVSFRFEQRERVVLLAFFFFFFLSFRCASVFLYLFHYSIDGDARRPFLISLLSLSLRNKGGTPEGVVLEDEKTLEECGITRSMGLFEYLWVDSKENQEKYKEEKARMFKILPNHEKFMEEYAAEHPGKGDFDALSDEFLEKGAPNKGSKLFKETISDEEYFKDAEKIQAKVERELEEYNAKEDEEREKKFGKEEQE